MKLSGRSVLAGLIVGAALSGAAPAFSSDFLVEPVVALLSPRAPSALLNLSNTGDKPVRFELTSYAWSQDLYGGIVLAPTDDVIFFPQLFTLGGGEQRKIRVGPASRLTPKNPIACLSKNCRRSRPNTYPRTMPSPSGPAWAFQFSSARPIRIEAG